MLKKPLLQPAAPWRQRIRAPYIGIAQTARLNRARGLATTTVSGKYQLYAWDVEANTLRQLTFRSNGVPFGSISPDGRYVYYLEDNNGNEIGHFVRVPWEGGTPEDITPQMAPYSAFGINYSGDGNLIATTISDSEGFHAIIMPVASNTIGAPREIYRSKRMMFGPNLSADGRIAIVASHERGTLQHLSMVALDTTSANRISELWDGEEADLRPYRFSSQPGDYRFIAISSRTGYNRPFIWEPLTGKRSELALPDLPGDVSPMDWSPDGKKLLLAQSHLAKQKMFIYKMETGLLKALDHPEGYYGMGTSFGPEDEIFAGWQDPTNPPQLIALDAHTGKKTRTILPAGGVPPGHPWKHITFKSTDGEIIQGWLGLPEGKGPFPTILHTHGGPETLTVQYFLPESQAWLDHGFAWLAINYRGSAGFGRQFREKIWGDLGNWELEDMAAAREWLVWEGISQPNRIMLTGWSYGGYLTCLALGKQPDLWAGGMAGMVTVDWAMEYEDLSPMMRGYSVAMMGGTPQEKPEQYAKSSPMTYIQYIKSPLLIIQGRNDTRTPARPVDVFEAKMKSLGKQIEVHWFDEGHFGGGVEQDIEDMETMLKFAYVVLGKQV